MKRPAVAFIAWSSVSGRSVEIAEALGGEARCYYDFRIVRRSLVPIRYLVSALRTVAYLVVRRPRALIVTNPPVFVAVVAYPYALVMRTPLLLDSHPDAFRSDGPHARFLGIHAWLARRASGTLVTTGDLVRQVEAWGGVGLVVHEPPPVRPTGALTSLPPRPRVLILGTLSSDEPVEEVLTATGSFPDVDFEITGDPLKRPPELIDRTPDNVRFLGFVGEQEYAAALTRCSIAIVLTNWVHTAVPRSAYDAVYALRPLVLSRSTVLQELFPFAVPASNDPASIVSALEEAIERHEELVRVAPDALELQVARWQDQLDQLRALIVLRS